MSPTTEETGELKLDLPFPLEGDDQQTRKSKLLKSIHSKISKGSVSEKILQLLEGIEEVDQKNGRKFCDSMSGLYCLVAKDCTLRCTFGNDLNSESYSKIVKRIWSDRTSKLELKGSKLLTCEWRELKNKFESEDFSLVMDKFKGINTTREALERARLYVREELGFMESSLGQVRTEHENQIMEVGADRITALATRRTVVLPPYEHVLARRQLKLSALGCKADLQVVKERFNPTGKEIEVANQSIPSCIELTSEWNDLLNSHSPTNKYFLRSSRPKANNETAAKKRRIARKFSKEEEAALTKGVKQFGLGEWKQILQFYPSVFEGRTKVDLKDKWRNMTKLTN